MKLGDNGEAFFVEETEEEYVSLKVSLGTWCQASRTRLRTTAQLFPCLCGRLLLPNKLSLHVEL